MKVPVIINSIAERIDVTTCPPKAYAILMKPKIEIVIPRRDDLFVITPCKSGQGKNGVTSFMKNWIKVIACPHLVILPVKTHGWIPIECKR